MAVILAEQVLIFEYDDNVTAYRNNSNPSLFLPVAGETYTITWDGTEYICKAVADEDAGMVRIGNLLPYGGEDTGEPFVISSRNDGDGMSIYTFDTAETHTLGVYQTSSEETEQPDGDLPTEEKTGISITLYDRTGAAVNYENVEKITTDTPDAEQGATFTYGVAVENAEYEPDFANGNQKVTLEKGQLLKEFTVVKPENLLPEYIKKNVEVAGIVGEFAGDEMEKTVELAMVDGDQVIEADEDTVLTKVVVKKPETLVPENIVDGVNIGGVVGNKKGITASLLDGTDDFELTDTMFDKPPVSIRTSCFYGASTLTRVSLSQVTRAPHGAFGGCYKLSEVYMPNCTHLDDYAFRDCNKLTPECMTFGELSYASILTFSGMSNYSRSYPDGVYTVGGNFIIAVSASMKSKTYINFDDYSEVTAIGKNLFSGGSITYDVEGSRIKYVQDYAFARCSSLYAVSFPNCQYLGSSVFYSCSKLMRVNLPNCVSVGSNPFYMCSMLYSVNLGVKTWSSGFFLAASYALNNLSLPNVLTIGSCSSYKGLVSVYLDKASNINQNAFYGLTNLKTVEAPQCVSVGSYAFYNCYMLSSVILNQSSSVTLYAYAFAKALSGKTVTILSNMTLMSNCFNSCSMKEVVFVGLKSVYPGVFQSCINLQKVQGNLQVAWTTMFAGCKNLEKVDIKLTRIGMSAFSNCGNLKLLRGNYLSYVSSSAFVGCSNLSVIVLNSFSSVVPSQMNANPFNGTPIADSSYLGYYGSIYVPESLTDVYKTASVWSLYADRITPITDEVLALFENEE